jgi:hypothetical protein
MAGRKPSDLLVLGASRIDLQNRTRTLAEVAVDRLVVMVPAPAREMDALASAVG